MNTTTMPRVRITIVAEFDTFVPDMWTDEQTRQQAAQEFRRAVLLGQDVPGDTVFVTAEEIDPR